MRVHRHQWRARQRIRPTSPRRSKASLLASAHVDRAGRPWFEHRRALLLVCLERRPWGGAAPSSCTWSFSGWSLAVREGFCTRACRSDPHTYRCSRRLHGCWRSRPRERGASACLADTLTSGIGQRGNGASKARGRALSMPAQRRDARTLVQRLFTPGGRDEPRCPDAIGERHAMNP